MKQLVNRADWQMVRNDLKGTWKKHPAKNVQTLRSWLGGVSNASDDQLRIAMNYLTGSGFRMGKITHPSIQKLRTEISVEMRKRKFKGKEK